MKKYLSINYIMIDIKNNQTKLGLAVLVTVLTASTYYYKDSITSLFAKSDVVNDSVENTEDETIVNDEL
jgi:hypothetical protein